MKKIVITIAVVVIFAFLASLIFHEPGIYPAVVCGIALIFAYIYARQRSLGKIIATAVVVCLLILGGSKLNKAISNLTFSVSPAHASDMNEIFIVDAQSIDYPVPVKVAAAAPETVEVSYETASSGGCSGGHYPEKVQPWCGFIEAAAAKYGVDPLLIASVMVIESGGQPEVLSSSGAVGLLQVMPSDGISASFQCINGPCFANRPTIAELKNPEFNVNYGTKMLAGLISKWGNERDALKAYGPNPYDLLYLYGSEYWYADKVLGVRNDL